ncbi:MAG: heme exporter protein D [Paracoccaceae bacterium]|jgi:heme exporter protein D|tara:strand:+ start:738 stop:938 length:201 start_codon:yes stop_codon:yes gene_type:complete
MDLFTSIVDMISTFLGLGKYGLEVLSSYVISLAMLALLVWISARRAAKVRAELAAVEARLKDSNDG